MKAVSRRQCLIFSNKYENPSKSLGSAAVGRRVWKPNLQVLFVKLQTLSLLKRSVPFRTAQYLLPCVQRGGCFFWH
jgi:hypothetical protein